MELFFLYQTFHESFSTFFLTLSGQNHRVILVKSLFQGTCFSSKAGAKIWIVFYKTNFRKIIFNYFSLSLLHNSNCLLPFILYIGVLLCFQTLFNKTSRKIFFTERKKTARRLSSAP
jgi:hypothetical protein